MSFVCRIEVFSHFILVKNLSPKVTYVIREFCSNLVQFKLEKVKHQFIKIPSKIFAASPMDRREYRFNRNQLEDLITKFKFAGYTKDQLDIFYVPLYEPVAASVQMPETWSPRPNQIPIIEYGAGEGHIKVFTLQTGQGKALPNETPVRVPFGWRFMGDLKPGDYVVNRMNIPVMVLAVYPQGLKDVCELTFSDNRKIQACFDHLWTVRVNYHYTDLLDTRALIDLVNNGNVVEIPEFESNGDEVDGTFVTIAHDPEPRYVQLEKIIQLEDLMECTCITVDDPENLYVSKDNIVTHNTSCGLKVGELLGKRMAIVVLGRYFEKWVGDVSGQYGLKPGKLLAVRGYKQLKTIFEMIALGTYDADVIIISSTTMRDYIDDYEATAFEGYPDHFIHPQEFYQKLGVGFRIIDEAHQHFHLNFRMDLYTHIPKALYLSATLEPDDPFVDRMYKLAYPLATRMSGGAYIRYANVTAVEYRLRFYDKARYTGHGGQYSHVEYEKWLMRKPSVLQNYMEMIWALVDADFLKIKKPGQKCLVFAATKEMCQKLRDYIAHRAPKNLKVSKYTADEDYEILLSSDISVSTLGSSGTAVDIPRLLTCIMSTSLKDSQANLQALGRLRELRDDPDQVPHFIYLYCADIKRQVEYHRKKVELFQERVLTQQIVMVAKQI